MNDWFPIAESRPIDLYKAWAGVGEPEVESDISRYAIGQEWHRLKPGTKSDKYLSLVRASFDKPSPALTRTAGQTTSAASVTHPLECRKYSLQESKRVASYPDSFKFVDWATGLERIGNSVPPLLMRSIARNIKSMLQTGQPYRVDGKSGFSKIDYPAILAEAWRQHLAPKADDAPTVISTFAGCGGSSLGYSMAGYRELLAVEWDDNAVETFKLNFPDVPVYHGDIAKLSVDECLEMTSLEPGQLDVFDGSPPCQGFSTAGKRKFDDDRNQLFREYVRLLRGLRPKVFVMENVSGMVKGKMKLIFADILRELKASGYRVSARLLNAMYFHVPQSRERMIFIGVREDLEIEPSHPGAMNRPIAVRAAIEDCAMDIEAPVLSGKFGDLSRRLKPGQNISDITGSYGHGNQRIEYGKPSPTLVKTAMFGAPKMIHPSDDRGLSIGEAKRIGSFPDAFQMIGDYRLRWQRIGNSVPPLLMRSVAQHIRQSILTNSQPVRVEA